jgi:hypothetical protein
LPPAATGSAPPAAFAIEALCALFASELKKLSCGLADPGRCCDWLCENDSALCGRLTFPGGKWGMPPPPCEKPMLVEARKSESGDEGRCSADE